MSLIGSDISRDCKRHYMATNSMDERKTKIGIADISSHSVQDCDSDNHMIITIERSVLSHLRLKRSIRCISVKALPYCVIVVIITPARVAKLLIYRMVENQGLGSRQVRVNPLQEEVVSDLREAVNNVHNCISYKVESKTILDHDDESLDLVFVETVEDDKLLAGNYVSHDFDDSKSKRIKWDIAFSL